jgi:hypothetical protein
MLSHNRLLSLDIRSMVCVSSNMHDNFVYNVFVVIARERFTYDVFNCWLAHTRNLIDKLAMAIKNECKCCDFKCEINLHKLMSANEHLPRFDRWLFDLI